LGPLLQYWTPSDPNRLNLDPSEKNNFFPVSNCPVFMLNLPCHSGHDMFLGQEELLASSSTTEAHLLKFSLYGAE